jgi:hypothetical protein
MGHIETIFVFMQRTKEFSPYAKKLSSKISSSSLPTGVIEMCGKPTQKILPQTVPVLGRSGHMLRYDYPSHSIHFEFLPDDGPLKMVTFMTADVTPGREKKT